MQLAAGERADAPVDEALGVDVRKTGEDFFTQGLCRAEKRRAAGDAAGEQIQNADRVALGEVRALRNVADAELALAAVRPVECDAAGVFLLAEDGADERGLARAVRADECDDLTAVHVQIDVCQRLLCTEADGEIFDLQTAGVAAVAALMVDDGLHFSASLIVFKLCCIAEK